MKRVGHCIEKVNTGHWTNLSMVPCGLPAGHGPGESYCKRHARRFLPVIATWWAIEPFNPAPVEVRVQAFTESSYVSEGTLRRREANLFETWAEARDQMVRQAAEALQDTIEEAEKRREHLRALVLMDNPTPKKEDA